MAAQLGWQQKWSASGLSWSAAWSDGHSIGTGNLAGAGHATIAGALAFGIEKQLGAVSLAAVGRSTAGSNITMAVPEQVILGNLSLGMRGRSTVAAAFDSVDPKWLDPPLALPAGGRMAFQGTVSFATVLLKPLGAVSLPMVARSTMTGAISRTIRHSIGTASLPLVGGSTIAGALSTPSGPPFALEVTSFALGGRATLTGDPRTALPPHEMGAASMAMSGEMATSVISLFSGGPKAIGALALPMVGRMAARSNLTYPPFDQQLEIRAAIDPVPTAAKLRVDNEEISLQ